VSEPVTLFSIELELGPETRALVERLVASTTVTMQLEFGPETLATVSTLFPRDATKPEAGEGIRTSAGAERPEKAL
jgi:hypothetical protein